MSRIPPSILSATCALLGPYLPELDAPALVQALQAARTTSETPHTADRLVTINDAAKHLCVSRRTMWRFVQDGRVKAVRMGPRTVRFRLQDLDAFAQPVAIDAEDVNHVER